MPHPALLGILVLLAGGCSHLAEVAPAGINISGTWVTQQPPQAPPAASVFDPEATIETTLPDGSMGEGVEAPPFRGLSPRLPMLSAPRMTIDQDPTSMGIDYPNQPYRDVKWGRQQRGPFVVDAGWDADNRLIVQTSSRPMHIKEIYSLSADGSVLTLQVELSGRSAPTTHIVRTFTRAEPAPP
jgi:hypothetical protein